jgi:hypothetical protein
MCCLLEILEWAGLELLKLGLLGRCLYPLDYDVLVEITFSKLPDML